MGIWIVAGIGSRAYFGRMLPRWHGLQCGCFSGESEGGSFGKFNSLFHSNRGRINTLAYFYIRGSLYTN